MATITPDKTPAVTVLAHQAVTHKTTIVGSSISALTKKKVILFLFHAYIEATADTNPGKFMVQVRPDAGGGTVNEHWVTIAEYVVKGTTPTRTQLTATEASGEVAIAVTSDTGFVFHDLVYLQDVDNLVTSEWGQLQETTTNIVTLMDGLRTEKVSADFITNDASSFVCALNLDSIESYRVIWTHEGGTGANGHIKVEGITHDSDTST